MRNDSNIKSVNVIFRVLLIASGVFAFAVYIPYAIISNTTGFNQHNMDYYRDLVLVSLGVTFYSLIICLVFLLWFLISNNTCKSLYYYLFLASLFIFLTILYTDPGGIINWILD